MSRRGSEKGAPSLTLHTERDALADRWRHIVGGNAQVGAHLSPFQAQQPQRGAIVGFHCITREQKLNHSPLTNPLVPLGICRTFNELTTARLAYEYHFAILTAPDDARLRIASGTARQRRILALLHGQIGGGLLIDDVWRHWTDERQELYN